MAGKQHLISYAVLSQNPYVDRAVVESEVSRGEERRSEDVVGRDCEAEAPEMLGQLTARTSGVVGQDQRAPAGSQRPEPLDGSRQRVVPPREDSVHIHEECTVAPETGFGNSGHIG
jgi:hypothetical protein